MRRQAAGVAGLIVPDLLIEEADRLAGICRRRDISLIQLVTPTTSRQRAVRIANSSTGFLYYVSVTGITGQRDDLPPAVVDQVGWLREQTELPDLHRLRDQSPGTRADAPSGRRWHHCRLGNRPILRAIGAVGWLRQVARRGACRDRSVRPLAVKRTESVRLKRAEPSWRPRSQ